MASLQAQKEIGAQALSQASGYGLQGGAQQLDALQYAAQLEAQREAELQAQRGIGLQALTQAGGLNLQQRQQELAALEAAAQRESARESQFLQGIGLSTAISQEEFRQSAIARDLEREKLVSGSAVTSDIVERDLREQAREQAMEASLLTQEQDMEARRRAENYAREQQALTTAGQAFTMQQRIAPDVTAYMGRPASQGAGLDVLGVSQQQAQYGTTPKAFNYDVGVNVAMAEQANLTALQGAQTSASAAKKAGMYSGLGNVVGSFLGTEAGAGGIMDIFGSGGGTSGGGTSGGGSYSNPPTYNMPQTSFEQWNPLT